MKKRLMAYGIILLAVVNVTALFTLAYNRWVRRPSAPAAADTEGRLPSAKTRLLLSAEQMGEMRNLRASFEAEIKEIQLQMEEKRKALVEEMRKESQDSALIDRLIDEIGRLQSEVQKKAVRHLFKEKQLLTPEQKERFFEMFEDHVCPRLMAVGHPSRGQRGSRWLQENEIQPGLRKDPMCKDRNQ